MRCRRDFSTEIVGNSYRRGVVLDVDDDSEVGDRSKVQEPFRAWVRIRKLIPY